MHCRSALLAAITALSLAFLAGCGGAPGGASSIAATRAPAASGRDPRAGDSLAALPAVTEPSRLKGLSTPQVQALLGAPAFKRRDPPAEIWQYRSRRCTLDLFIYQDGGSPQRVEHYTVRSPSPVAEKDCFGELLALAAPGS